MFKADFAVPAGGPQGPQQHPAEDGRGRLGKTAHIKLQASLGRVRQSEKPLLAERVEPLAVLPDQGRGAGNGRPGRPLQRAVQLGKHAMADAVARIARSSLVSSSIQVSARDCR